MNNKKKNWRISKRRIRKAKTYNPNAHLNSHHGSAHEKISTKAENARYKAAYRNVRNGDKKIFTLSGGKRGINDHLEGDDALIRSNHNALAKIDNDNLKKALEAPRWKKIDRELSGELLPKRKFLGWASAVKNKSLAGVDRLPFERYVAMGILFILVVLIALFIFIF